MSSMPRTYQRHWQSNIRVWKSNLVWLLAIIILLYASGAHSDKGSGDDDSDRQRLIEYAGDESIITTSNRECVLRQFSGQGFRIQDIVYNDMFICPNGMIKFKNGIYQNWPNNYGTRMEQMSDTSLSPYWAIVNLPAFATGDSKVLFQNYHIDTNPNPTVFEKVNMYVNEFISDFNATWITVVTYKDIRPEDTRDNTLKNTFQVVFASNETSWYIMFLYYDICWAVGVPREEHADYIEQSGHPVIGRNYGKNGFDYRNRVEYENLPGSGSVNAEAIDDAMGNLGRGRWIFTASTPRDRSPRLRCYDWYNGEVTVARRRILQCPRTEAQAARDRRFQRQDKFERICYVRRFPQSGTGLRCCYDVFGGPLLQDPPAPGGFLLRNPLYFDVSSDDEAYLDCCVRSDLCSAYVMRRPKQRGRGYVPRRSAVGYGDPHYENLDGMEFTYNGCGEYMFLLANDNSLQIHVRFSVAIGAGLGTVVSAVLLKVDGVVPIQVNHNKRGSPGLLLHVGGAQNDDANDLIVGGKVSVDRNGDNEINLVTDEGHSLTVTREPENLVLVVTLERSLFGMTMGLLGNWSDTMADDFHLPNGTNLGVNLTDEQIHFDFGESWALLPSQNLFVDTIADADFFCPQNYTPIFLNDFTFPNSSFQTAAINACGGNTNCLFDVAATQLVSFGETTRDSFNAFEVEQSIIENSAPTFDVTDVVFNLTVGEEFVYTISANDSDGDDIEFITVGLPDSANVDRNDNSITISWLVTSDSTQPFNMSFLVIDSKNTSSVLVPAIRVCACENRGNCSEEATTMQTQDLLFNLYKLLSCDCNLGLTGQFCEEQRDFCQTEAGSPCHPQTTCMNSQTNFVCGGCPSGFSGDGLTCTDIDECTSGTHDCEMRCRNNAGGFSCECMDGYRLDANMKNCSDINECLTAHGCQQICVNEEGSFSCDCTENFIVDSMNSRNCVPRFSCPADNSCQQVCALDVTNNNEQVCSCNPGYTVDPNNPTLCVDINECESFTNLCNQLCNNTMGGFTCSCLSGYQLEADSFTCQDINECITPEAFTCDTNTGGEKCVNLPGTFRCECNDNQGFVLVDGICQIPGDNQVDIIVPPDDPPAATQEQIDSSVQLRLPQFQNSTYDRTTDIAFRKSIAMALTIYCNRDDQRRTECNLPGHGFEFSESNIFRIPDGTIQDGDDTLVSFYGNYPDGIVGGSIPRAVLLGALNERLDFIVGLTEVPAVIEDINECTLSMHNCEQFCSNSPGSFVCSCLQGYQLNSNMASCLDINECDAQTDVCNNNGTGQICRNIVRSFVCECNRTMGFGLINGVCQALNGSIEMPPEPRNASIEQRDNAVELHIRDFTVQQYDAQTNTQLKSAIAEALNNYCNVSATRRSECGLSISGFEFNEQDIHRIPSDPTQDGDDTSVSFYALYPNGTVDGTDIPVPEQLLSNAIRENLDSIRGSTGLDISLDKDAGDDEPFDWPLALGLSLAGALLVVLGIGVCCVCCRRGYFGAARKRRRERPMQYVYDAYRHRPRRRLPNVADLDPSFGTFHSMSGETYSGFDEDGLPVDIQTTYDGLSQPARTVSHVPTIARSRASIPVSHVPTIAGSRASIG